LLTLNDIERKFIFLEAGQINMNLHSAKFTCWSSLENCKKALYMMESIEPLLLLYICCVMCVTKHI